MFESRSRTILNCSCAGGRGPTAGDELEVVDDILRPSAACDCGGVTVCENSRVEEKMYNRPNRLSVSFE